MRTHCAQPDRDEPRIECGYPLPCPRHTRVSDEAILDVDPRDVVADLPTPGGSTPRPARKPGRGRTVDEIIALVRELDAMQATPEQANRIIDRLVPGNPDEGKLSDAYAKRRRRAGGAKQ